MLSEETKTYLKEIEEELEKEMEKAWESWTQQAMEALDRLELKLMEELKQKSEMEMAIEEGDFTEAWELEKEIDEAQAQLMRMRETN